MAKFCTNCGREMGDNDSFCPSCGMAVQGQSPLSTQPQQPMGAPYPQVVYVQAKPTVPGRGFGIASLVMGLVNLVPIIYTFIIFSFSIALVANLMNVKRVIPEPIEQSGYSQSVYYAGYDKSEGNLEKAEKEMIGEFILNIPAAFVISIVSLVFAREARKRGYVNKVSKAGFCFGVFELTLSVIFLCILIMLAMT